MFSQSPPISRLWEMTRLAPDLNFPLSEKMTLSELFVNTGPQGASHSLLSDISRPGKTLSLPILRLFFSPAVDTIHHMAEELIEKSDLGHRGKHLGVLHRDFCFQKWEFYHRLKSKTEEYFPFSLTNYISHLLLLHDIVLRSGLLRDSCVCLFVCVQGWNELMADGRWSAAADKTNNSPLLSLLCIPGSCCTKCPSHTHTHTQSYTYMRTLQLRDPLMLRHLLKPWQLARAHR